MHLPFGSILSWYEDLHFASNLSSLNSPKLEGLARKVELERTSVNYMFRALIRFIAFVPLFFAASSVWAQETPQDVSICDLAKHPKPFDGKMIRVRGSLNVNFEDFTLSVEGCDSQQAIWMAFGGDTPGVVTSMVNDNFRKPGEDVKVNGVSYGIKKDESFRRLYALIAATRGDKPEFRVTATLTGAFFAGEEIKPPNGQSTFRGYGHMGCCALLLITQVSDVESIPPANLNIRGTVLGPDGRPLEGFVVFDDVLGGSPPERQQTTTNAKGEFEFSISGQLLRFENPNYRPLALAVEPGGAPVNVKLEDAKRSDWLIPSCGEMEGSASRIGFSILFVLPTTMESRPFNGDDLHYYSVFPRGDGHSPEFLILYSAVQTPESSAFVNSSWSEQRWIKDGAGTVVGIDSRGLLKDGGRWRTAIFFGKDEARYIFFRGVQTSSLDGIINSACIAKR